MRNPRHHVEHHARRRHRRGRRLVPAREQRRRLRRVGPDQGADGAARNRRRVPGRPHYVRTDAQLLAGQIDDKTGVSDYLNRVHKYVVSSRLDDSGGWEPTTILRELDDVRALKAKPGADIVVTGSVTPDQGAGTLPPRSRRATAHSTAPTHPRRRKRRRTPTPIGLRQAQPARPQTAAATVGRRCADWRRIAHSPRRTAQHFSLRPRGDITCHRLMRRSAGPRRSCRRRT